MTRYQAVLFDLDDTLRFSRPSHREVFARVLAEQGFPRPPERLRALWRWSHAFWANQKEVERMRKIYRDRPEAFWQAWTEMQLRFLEIPKPDRERVARALHQALMHWRETHQDWVPESHRALLQELKTRGLRLGLVTNRGETLDQDYLAHLGLAPFFEAVVVAADVGLWKPHPRLFQVALEQLGISGSRALYVGDNFFADYQGARAAGLDAVLFDPMDLFSELEIPRIHTLPEIKAWLDGAS